MRSKGEISTEWNGFIEEFKTRKVSVANWIAGIMLV